MPTQNGALVSELVIPADDVAEVFYKKGLREWLASLGLVYSKAWSRGMCCLDKNRLLNKAFRSDRVGNIYASDEIIDFEHNELLHCTKNDMM